MIHNRDLLAAEMTGVETRNAIDQWMDDSLHIASELNALYRELGISGQVDRANAVAAASDAIIDAVSKYQELRKLGKEVMSQ